MGNFPSDYSAQILPMKGELRGRRDANGPLGGLQTTPLAGRFCAWRGASDRRYIATVAKLDRTMKDLGLPDFDAFVLIAVASTGGARRIVDVVAVGGPSERRGAIARALTCGIEEWHVHLAGMSRLRLDAIADDLCRRHIGRLNETRCA